MEEGLNNNEFENSSFFGGAFEGIKEKWNGLKTWVKYLIVSIIVLLVVGIVVVIIVYVKNKDDSGVPKETMEVVSKKEGFVASNDLTENDYVNSYIEATRGEIEAL